MFSHHKGRYNIANPPNVDRTIARLFKDNEDNSSPTLQNDVSES